MVAWERLEYTVLEQDGTFEVCAAINGSNRDNLAVYNIRLLEGTAKEGEGIELNSAKLILFDSVLS